MQLHRGFTFDDARRIVPYLAALGVSHLYTSPFLRARAGSTHGYDVVDHDELNPEIGSEADLAALTADLRAHGMSLMLDLVPNHMGVLKADNPWWLEVLEHGLASPYADYFDIDWSLANEDTGGKVLVPILDDQYGVVLERGDLVLRFGADTGELSLWFHEHRLPIRPVEYPRVLLANASLLARDAAEALRRIADAFAAVPVVPDGVRDAAQLGGTAKTALVNLCARNPDVAQLVAASVAGINGTPGNAKSFDALDALIGGQAYRLAHWRVAADDINYRRFFDINDLAALRAEREEVFAATHRRALALVAAGDADALRVDHPDGLADPAAYFERLQKAAAAAGVPGIYLVIEKILAGHERLPAAWPVHGDTGYRFLNAVNALFVDPRARLRFDRLYAASVGEQLDFDAVVRRAKALIVRYALASDLNRLTSALTRIVKRDRHTRDHTANAIRRALIEIVAAFPVYRTYATADARSAEDQRYVDWAIAVAKRASASHETSVYDFIGEVLRGDWNAADPAVAEFVRRFQQLTAPAMAKGLEDTSFYIYHRLASLNEVGGDPRAFGVTVGAFHRATLQRARQWPHALLATSTHDNKRSEDVRARIDALSEWPAVWRLALRRWHQFNRRYRREVHGVGAPSRNDEYLLYQTLIGAWPLGSVDQASLDAFRGRIQAYMQKAVREAKVHTSWINVDAAYEAALAHFVDGLLGTLEPNPFLADFLPLASRIAAAGCVTSLAQTAIKLTAPGVPDTYQGTELFDFSLVDPDNRRPVDYALRTALLHQLSACDASHELAAELLSHWQDGRVKLWLTSRLLQLRMRRAEWFRSAAYLPLRTRGTHRNSVCAYLRRGAGVHVLCVTPRLWQGIVGERGGWPVGAAVWQGTTLALPQPPRQWRNVLTGEVLEPSADGLAVGCTLAALPVAVFESD